MVGAFEQREAAVGELGGEVARFIGRAVLVVVAREDQHRPAEPAELLRWWKGRQGHVLRLQRDADQHQGGDAFIVDRFPQRDVGAERPTAHHAGQVRGLHAHALDRGAHITDLVPAAAVGAFRSHVPPEVEAQHGELPGPREFVPQRPQDGVVLAATVPWMGMTQHGRGARRLIGEPQLAFEPDTVLGRERHAFHDLRRWHPCTTNDNRSRVEGTAVALRDPLPWDRFAELVRLAESLELPGGVPAGDRGS